MRGVVVCRLLAGDEVGEDAVPVGRGGGATLAGSEEVLERGDLGLETDNLRVDRAVRGEGRSEAGVVDLLAGSDVRRETLDEEVARGRARAGDLDTVETVAIAGTCGVGVGGDTELENESGVNTTSGCRCSCRGSRGGCRGSRSRRRAADSLGRGRLAGDQVRKDRVPVGGRRRSTRTRTEPVLQRGDLGLQTDDAVLLRVAGRERRGDAGVVHVRALGDVGAEAL
jgi:hypothetical protein